MIHAQPTVSVVIPVYNKRRYLRRALHSVLAQSYTDFEVILVDDGSTDGSLDSIMPLTDRRVRFYWQPNAGVSAARNTGIERARAPLVAFLDADDTWEPGFLDAMLRLRSRYPKAGLYASAYSIKTPGAPARRARIAGLPSFRQRFLSGDYFRLGTRGELPVSASSVMIPRNLLLEVGGFPVGEKMGEDQHVWWRICVRHALAYDQRCLATYHRDAEERACPVNVPDRELPFSARLQDELPSLGLSLWQQWHANRYMGAHLLHLARENTRHGNTQVARTLMRDWRSWLLPVKWMVRRVQVAAAA
ncbi:MAG: glycosyltransferase family 2 protein [Pseudomonadota bacterium]